jgi:Na+-driven multidrug efflux pump
MVVLPAIGLARGVETVVGQNLGAKQVDRAKRGVRLTIGIVVGTFILFSVGVFAFAETIIGIFVSGAGEASVVTIGAEYLRTVSVTYGFLGIFYVVQGGFRGSGSTRVALLFAFVGFIVIRSVLAYVFAVPLEFGATGIWYGEAASNVLMAGLGFAYFRRGTWTDRVVDDEQAVGSDPSDEPHSADDQPPASGDQPADTD